MLTWTIGSGGLIGSEIASAADKPFPGPKIPWSDSQAAHDALRQGLVDFWEAAGEGPWAIIWAAGAGTTASPAAVFDAELATFRGFIDLLVDAPRLDSGVFTVISSAGGVHAGSIGAPFDEHTPPSPISDYGRAKLAQEEIAASGLDGRLPVLLCRVSNAYGPGQDLSKLQGLVSRLALCTYRHEPLNLFVPLTTVRDYIFTTDIAERVHSWISHVQGHDDRHARVVMIASGKGTSIAELIRAAGDVSHRKIPIAMSSHPSSANQPADSRFVPTPIPGEMSPSPINLPTGVKAVFDDIQRRLAVAVGGTVGVG